MQLLNVLATIKKNKIKILLLVIPYNTVKRTKN